MEVPLLQPGSLLLRLRDVDALVFHLKIRFGMQRYTFIEGFPPRSGEIFQADDRGNQRRDGERPSEAGGFLEDQNADEDVLCAFEAERQRRIYLSISLL